ncbi:MAG TPA: hypothetical protein VJ862_03140 [Rhodanobacteraceae bacterium]|nr:hypothetical protein [Rhodanobacteraceae bacterium]
MSNDREACPTARISVTVTDFHEVGERGGYSRADVELTDTGHGKVSQGRVNDVIVVHDEVYLEFSVHAREGDRYSYSPVGISFREERDSAKSEAADRHGDDRDLLGHTAFPMRTVVSRGRTMQLTLYDANPVPAIFKFDLVIQRSDGLLGIIDPPIQNKGRYN